MSLVRLCSRGYQKDFAESSLLEFVNEDGTPKDPMPKGDSLAAFVVYELHETYDADASDEQQLDEALRVIENGSDDLDNICDELRRLRQFGDTEPLTR